MSMAFHEGEVALQRSVGAAEHLAEVGPRVIRDHMPQQHRDFFRQLPFLVIGAQDANGQPWASVLAGPPGFVHSPHDRQLVVRALPSSADPLAGALESGAPIGMLGIEPHTRRRNRLNGRIDGVDGGGFSVCVNQSFGNCPKYIQARRAQFAPEAASATTVSSRCRGLDDAGRRSIAQADTFFIATAHPQAGDGAAAHGLDVSHRGGQPGFVRVQGDELTVPDLVGNAFFNTLGNLLQNPRCGLCLIDYESGDLLYGAAKGYVVTEPEVVRHYPGAQRLVHLQVVSSLRVAAALPLRWGVVETSPYLEHTGPWG